ncbi:hypothetical protein LC1Hm_2299 [Halomicrobium sp. LC1Hm]|nr:hypothetical protein LC1Hm_2299 [Halomicrobium sp. LC1Hm]
MSPSARSTAHCRALDPGKIYNNPLSTIIRLRREGGALRDATTTFHLRRGGRRRRVR